MDIPLQVSRSTRRAAFLMAASCLFFGCGSETSGWILGPIPDEEATVAPLGSGGELPAPASGGMVSLGGSFELGVGGTPPEPPPFWLRACTPSVAFQNIDSSQAGEEVEAALGDPRLLLQEAAQDTCRILYREESEVPISEELTLTLEAFSGVGTVSGTEVRMSSSYLKDFEIGGGDIRHEAGGVARFLLAHVYGHSSETTPSWITSGKADYVRLASGFLDEGAAQPGGAWTDGFRTTAYFFAHLATNEPDFAYLLNTRLAPAEPEYEDAIFQELIGAELSTLWDEYQSTFP